MLNSTSTIEPSATPCICHLKNYYAWLLTDNDELISALFSPSLADAIAMTQHSRTPWIEPPDCAGLPPL